MSACGYCCLFSQTERGKIIKIISISNIKGGVKKTTTAAVLAVGLADKGYRVLMVDNDPQANLAMCFKLELPDEGPSLYHVYCVEKRIDDIKLAVKDRLDLVAGGFGLCNADIQFTKVGRLKMLQKAVVNSNLGYDFIIIDTLPNLGVLSLNTFLASDHVVVPMAADSFSLKGVRLLKQTLNDVAEETERELPVVGILLTQYNSRTNVSRLLEKSLNSAAELLGTEVFKSRIRQAVAIQESQTAKEDLFSYAVNAKVAEDYRGFIDEFIERVSV